MDAAHDSQILKGVLGLVLLRLIDERESYGYELVERVGRIGPDGGARRLGLPGLGRPVRDGT